METAGFSETSVPWLTLRWYKCPRAGSKSTLNSREGLKSAAVYTLRIEFDKKWQQCNEGSKSEQKIKRVKKLERRILNEKTKKN
jgi:hypothetical protein